MSEVETIKDVCISSIQDAENHNKWIRENHPTLRDQFAMAALTGELSSQSIETGEWLNTHLNGLTNRSYKIADAMLEAREKTDG